jgi:hypothetical protein
VLSKAQDEFLKTAAERFGHAEQANKEAVKSLLDPVHQRLKAYEEQVNSLEQKRVDAFGQLTGLIEGMRTGQEEIRREAQRLGNSLTNAPKARGAGASGRCRTCSSNAASRSTPISTPSIRSTPTRAACAPTRSCAFRQQAAGDRRQGLAQRLPGRVRGR